MSGRHGFLPMAALVLFLSAGLALAQVIDLDAERERKDRPEIWVKASVEAVKRAEEAARRQACTSLVEAVYRLPVSSSRDVLDMMIRNDVANKGLIEGFSKTQPVGAKYLDDGTVQMTVATTPAEVVKVLKQAYEKVDWDQAEEDAVIGAVARETKADTQVIGEGEAALAGSPGERKIVLRRAALVKAEQEIARKVLELVVDHGVDHIPLRDFVVDFKQVPKKMALGMGTTRIVTEAFPADDGVEMRAEVNVSAVTDLMRRAQSLYDQRGKWNYWGFHSVMQSTKEMIFAADVKASVADAVPDDAPLALESEAVQRALK